MLIDWFTVGAQAVNFLILVWLMKRFLYKPILAAIDVRERLIAKELADADSRKTEAGKERDEFAKKNLEFDQTRTALLTKATDEAKSERSRLLDEARKSADALGAKRLELLQSEARQLHAALGRRAQDEVFAIARKTLADLATASLEERLVEVFERRLREMDERTRSNLREAMISSSEPALVRSAFDLPQAQRGTLQTAINVMCSADIHLRFETAPEVIGGIELTSSGNKVSWSIAEYLSELQKAVDDLVQKQAKPAPQDIASPQAPMDSAPPKTIRAEPARPVLAAQPAPAPAPSPQAAAQSEAPPSATTAPAAPGVAPQVPLAPKATTTPETPAPATADQIPPATATPATSPIASSVPVPPVAPVQPVPIPAPPSINPQTTIASAAVPSGSATAGTSAPPAPNPAQDPA